MHELTVVSLMAANIRPTHAAICAYVAARLGVRARLVEDLPWREQLAMLDGGAAQLAFICGLPYSLRADRLQPLAAPVPVAPRYGGRPIYFSDLVVRADSPFQSLADLRGARWAYNEPGSLSGYAVPLAHLAGLGEPAGFFASAAESGAHLESIRMVLGGAADAAAIDSSVLDLALRDEPALAGRLRIIGAFGPNPAPPVVAAQELAVELRLLLRQALTHMHADPGGRASLAGGLIARLAPVIDADYDPVREIARRAAEASFA